LICVAQAQAQDSAVQQQLDQINGKVQDLLDAQTAQDKRLTALEKQVADLADKVNTPAINNSASADDLKKLAQQLQEVDQKRADDRELILKQIEKLGKINAEAAEAPVHHSAPANTASENSAPVAVDGYEYIVKKDDTLSTIAKAYREQHIHVTVAQILKANPGLDATKLYVGRKLIIPKPAQ
jgi:LysM repeat protein